MDFWRLPMLEISEMEGDTEPPQEKAGPEKEIGPAAVLREIKDGGHLVLEATSSEIDPAATKAQRDSRGGRGKGTKHGKATRHSAFGDPDTPQQQPQQQWHQQHDQGKGGGKRGQKGKGWVDIPVDIPKRPDAKEESPEVLAKQELETRQLQVRDQLRSATTVELLQSAVVAARELGLVDEVKVAEKKIAKMEAV